MAEFDQKHMNDAIALAQECAPFEERIPLVGAVIAIGPTVIGRAHRGTGKPGGWRPRGKDCFGRSGRQKAVARGYDLHHARTVYTRSPFRSGECLHRIDLKGWS